MENSKTPLDKFTELIGTVLTATEDSFQKILDEFIVNQNFGKKEADDFSKKMKDIYNSNKTKLISLIDEAVKKSLNKADIARASEINELKDKIKALEEKIEHTQVHTGHNRIVHNGQHCHHRKPHPDK